MSMPAAAVESLPLYLYARAWAHLDSSGLIWAHLDPSGLIWTHLDSSGPHLHVSDITHRIGIGSEVGPR